MKTRMKICLTLALLLAVALIGCGFAAKPVPTPDVPAAAQGNDLSASVSAPAPEESSPEITIPKSLAPDLPDTKTVTVTTADEFISAIDSNVTIRIDAALLDLSTATGYGENFGSHWRWAQEFDGPTLEIHDVENLRIIGGGRDVTTIQAVPRYADVLRFVNCKNLILADFTAGHLKEAPGSCSGMVLTFRSCSDVDIRLCGLFGCGVNGIVAEKSSKINVSDTEIYECSSLGAVLSECSEVAFDTCTVRDCGSNTILVYGTNGDCTWDGKVLKHGENKVG